MVGVFFWSSERAVLCMTRPCESQSLEVFSLGTCFPKAASRIYDVPTGKGWGRGASEEDLHSTATAMSISLQRLSQSNLIFHG